MGRLGTLIFGIILGVIGAIAIVKFPELTKKALLGFWELAKTVFEYLKTRIA